MRAQSAPSTPSHIKNVHFAEKDSGLETIRVYNRTGKPASLSKPPGEETETETETGRVRSGRDEQADGTWTGTRSFALLDEREDHPADVDC